MLLAEQPTRGRLVRAEPAEQSSARGTRLLLILCRRLAKEPSTCSAGLLILGPSAEQRASKAAGRVASRLAEERHGECV